jgi:hypothetical protein
MKNEQPRGKLKGYFLGSHWAYGLSIHFNSPLGCFAALYPDVLLNNFSKYYPNLALI